MSYKEWGNSIWYLFHGLAEKLKPEHSNFSVKLMGQFYNICNNLPCDMCTNHAISILSNCNLNNINTKEALQTILWKFHNEVNKKINKPLFTKLECDNLYKKCNINNIIHNFRIVMLKNGINNKAMMGSFNRKRVLNQFDNFINSNIDKFYI